MSMQQIQEVAHFLYVAIFPWKIINNSTCFETSFGHVKTSSEI